MVRYESKYVVCPFYHNEENLKIYCEGIDDNATTISSWRSLGDKLNYRKEYCQCLNNYNNCLLASALFRKHGQVEKSGCTKK